uniref:Cytosolic protein n=1 Tax=candidate division WOR-3 bacterium TaxID=2052148 RepID=A0A7C4GF68_UNCW3
MNTDCRVELNHADCTCTYEPCPRKGRCCECISYHRRHKEVPGCLFPSAAEKTYDRSVTAFIAACRQ